MEQLIDFHAPEVQAVLDTLLKDKSTGKNIIWATDPRGRSGWVHQGYLDGDTVLRDYDARELDGNAGDSVRMIELAGGWWWVENEIAERGWLPERVLAIEPGMK